MKAVKKLGVLSLSCVIGVAALLGPPDTLAAKEKFKILCKLNASSQYDCDVKGNSDSSKIKEQVEVPAGSENVVPLISQADGPPPDHTHTTDDPLLNGKHCWIQVNGVWTSIHC